MSRLLIAFCLGGSCVLLAQLAGCSLSQPVDTARCVRDCLRVPSSSTTVTRSQLDK